MRFLLTTHQFFPHFAAGTEILTYSVARELIKRGHTVHIVTGYPGDASLSDGARFDEYDFEGIHVYRFSHSYTPMGGQTSMIAVGYDNILGAAYFNRILEDFKPDVVHFFHLNRLGTGLIERAVEAGIPSFMTPTDFWVICPMGQLLLDDGRLCTGPSIHAGNCLKHFARITQKGVLGKVVEFLPTSWVDQIARLTKNGVLPIYPKHDEVVALANRIPVNVMRLNKLSGIIAPNEFMRDFLVMYGVAAHLITVAAFGVDVTEPVIENGQRIEQRSPLRIAFIGTLAPHKGCHVLIEAFRMLTNESATLKIYGRLDDFPDYARSLEKLADKHTLISFCGTFPNSEIGQIFADIDVLIVPSLWYENTPLIIYSAQAAHCPVIASNLPGLAAVVQDKVNGLLFEPNNSIDLAHQIQLLINENGLLQRLSTDSSSPKNSKMYVNELLNLWQINEY